MKDASELIDALGGTQATARLCDVRPPSVSEWRIRGIPRARLMYLQALADIRQDVAAALSKAGYRDSRLAGGAAPVDPPTDPGRRAGKQEAA